MDLGIAGRWALVCGASRGLGLGCARALAAEGVHLVIVSRGETALQQAAVQLRALAGAGEVRCVAADITTEAGRAAALAACPRVDILVTNAGGPPAGDFRQFEREDWIAALDANMIAPIALIRATVDAMIERRFGRIVNITSSAVKAPIDILALSNGARSGLTGFVAGLARRTVQANVTLNNLLPGQFDTDRLRGNFDYTARQHLRRSRGRTEAACHPGRAFRPARRVRRGVRVPVQRTRRLHHRAEPADRWRRLPGHVLTLAC